MTALAELAFLIGRRRFTATRRSAALATSLFGGRTTLTGVLKATPTASGTLAGVPKLKADGFCGSAFSASGALRGAPGSRTTSLAFPRGLRPGLGLGLRTGPVICRGGGGAAAKRLLEPTTVSVEMSP